MKTAILSTVFILILNYTFCQEGDSIKSMIEFDSLEIAKIDSIVSLIPSSSISTFEAKYEAWMVSIDKPEFQLQSNPNSFKTKEFYDFKEYTLGLGDVYIGLLIDFYLQHDTGISYYLLLDITYDDYGHFVNEVKSELKIFYLDLNLWYQAYPIGYFKKILASIQVSDLIENIPYDPSGSCIFELDSMEIAKIDSIVSLIPSDSISTFEAKYQTWIVSTEKPEMQIHSNPEMFKTEEYYDFKEYTLELGDAYIGLLIDFFLEHDSGISYYLLLDIAYDDYEQQLNETITELESLELNSKTWHNALPICYFKKVLATIEVSELERKSVLQSVVFTKKQAVKIYPNPIHDYLTIEFELEKTETVSIKLYNSLGQLQDIISDEEMFYAGRNSVKWNRKDSIAPGNYFLIIESNGIVKSRHIVIK